MNTNDFRAKIKPTLDHLEKLLHDHGCAYVIGIEVGRGTICAGLSGDAERVIPVPFYMAASCIDRERFPPTQQAVRRDGFAPATDDAAPRWSISKRSSSPLTAEPANGLKDAPNG